MGFSNGKSMPQHLDPNPVGGRLWRCEDCDDLVVQRKMDVCSARNCERNSCADCITECRKCGDKFCHNCKRRGCITDGICEDCEP